MGKIQDRVSGDDVELKMRVSLVNVNTWLYN